MWIISYVALRLCLEQCQVDLLSTCSHSETALFAWGICSPSFFKFALQLSECQPYVLETPDL